MIAGSLGFGAGLSRVDPCSPRGLTLCCSLLCCTSPPSMCTHGLRSCRGPCCCLGLPPEISAETWFLPLCCCCCCLGVDVGIGDGLELEIGVDVCTSFLPATPIHDKVRVKLTVNLR